MGTDGRVAVDYDLAIPMMLMHYFPAGMLGLGLCALMASFMSGMAGNTTAFNTVWTYDIYQSYINKRASDEHYLRMGRAATVFGILISVAAAYVAQQFNNIMDLLQLVFAFVNAPLFATFMLGMFWKRATGHGAFVGLVSGTLAAAVHHGLTLPAGAAVGFKGGFIGTVLHTYPSEMAQNFWTAIFAWTTCFVVTILVSMVTAPRRDERTDGAGLLADAAPARRGRAALPAAGAAGGRRAPRDDRAQHHLLVGRPHGYPDTGRRHLHHLRRAADGLWPDRRGRRGAPHAARTAGEHRCGRRHADLRRQLPLPGAQGHTDRAQFVLVSQKVAPSKTGSAVQAWSGTERACGRDYTRDSRV